MCVFVGVLINYRMHGATVKIVVWMLQRSLSEQNWLQIMPNINGLLMFCITRD